MTLFDLIQADGITMKKAAGTHGGEYAGSCPFCGGNDRFRVWPEDRGGRYWCRGCGKSGDAIQYLRDTQGLSYHEACEKLGIKGKKGRRRATRKGKSALPAFSPREAKGPAALWQEKAGEFLEMAKKTIRTDAGKEARDFLNGRGLTDETISGAGIGWNPVDCWYDRNLWGLPDETGSTGKKKRIWAPAGHVIPCFDTGGLLIRLRIRRCDPGNGPRYVVLPGSAMAPMILGGGKQAFIILEAELDGFLVFQEAKDLTGVMALGSVTIRPDRNAHEILSRAETILVSLDSDGPGMKESWRFWRDTYGAKAKRWPVPVGKDPSEAWQEGLNIRAWIEAGLPD